MEWFAVLWEYSFMGMYAVCLLLSVVRFPRYYDTPLRYLPVLLAYTLLTEAIGTIIRDSSEYSLIIQELYYNNNWLIYNVFSLIFYGFYFFVYRHYVTAYRIQKWLTLGAILYIISVVLNALIADFRVVSQVYSYTVGSMVLIPASFLYLRQEYRFADRALMRRNLLVWVSAGVLIFQLGYTPIKYVRHLMALGEIGPIPWIRPIHLGLIYLMYGLFIVGFLVMSKMKKPGCPGKAGNNGV